jgi:flagellar hook-associated protein 2
VAESGTSPTNNDNTGLSSLAFDSAPSVPAVPDTGGALIASGMGTAGIPVQYGQDAKARINGLAVTSTTNTLTGNILGVTINLVNTTTTGYGTAGELKAPVSMSINEDVTPGVKNVQDFVTAYNALNSSLSDLIKYDPATKTAGLFQGDATIVGMQHLLRSMLGSASLGAASQHLADVGVLAARDGSLSIDTAKLSAAANNGTSLQQLFTNNNKNPLTNGFALKFRDLAKGVLATGGAVVNEAAALQRNLARNTAEQTKVTDRATLVEARLRAQYSALDTKMASLNSLSAYVSQQVTTWNKSTA